MFSRPKCIETLILRIIIQLEFMHEAHYNFSRVPLVVTKPDAAVFTTNPAIQGKYSNRQFGRLSLTVNVKALFALVNVFVDVNFYG